MTTSRILSCLTLLLTAALSAQARVIPIGESRTPLALREIRSEASHSRNPFDEHLNIRLNSDNSGQIQNEEQACISPIASNIFVAVWRDFRFGYRRVGVGYSHDSGETWSDALFPQMFYNWQSDPTLVVDSDGSFTANVITFNPPSPGGPSGLLQITSLDGGMTWQDSVWAFVTPQEPQGFTDKQMLAVDNTDSPFHGTYYCSWTHFYDDPDPWWAGTQILLTYKRPGQPYSQPIVLSDSSAVQWSNVCVGAEGEVYVSWCSYGYDAIMFSRSLDGGVTWSADSLLVETNFVSASINPDLLIFSYGVMDCDLSNGPHHGRLYMVFTDATPSFSETDIWFMYSDDQGQSWNPRDTSGVVRPDTICDEPQSYPIDQFHPWLSVDDEGNVWCIFYDRRNDPNNLLMDTYFTVSTDGGETWRANERISTVSSDPGAGSLDAGLIGEYIGWQARGGKALAVWTDTRNGNQDVYSSLIDSVFIGTGADDPRAVLPSQIAVSAYPNPTNGMALLSYSLASPGMTKLRLYDVTGRLVREENLGDRTAGEHTTSLILDELATGIYVAEVRAGTSAARTKLMLLK